MNDETRDKGLKDLELWGAKNLVIEAMKNDVDFCQEFMNELRQTFLFEKIKISSE